MKNLALAGYGMVAALKGEKPTPALPLRDTATHGDPASARAKSPAGERG